MPAVQYRVAVRVSSPDKLQKSTVYHIRIETVTAVIDEKPDIIDLYKRFSEVKAMENELRVYHRQLCRPEPFPSAGQAIFLNRTDATLVEERKASIENVINFICDREYLKEHRVFIKFCASSYYRPDGSSEVQLTDH